MPGARVCLRSMATGPALVIADVRRRNRIRRGEPQQKRQRKRVLWPKQLLSWVARSRASGQPGGLRHLLDDGHRILILSDRPRTTFWASFPRVLFENLDLEKITMDLAENFKNTG